MRLVVRAEPEGLLLFDPETTVLVELNRSEARRLGYQGSFPTEATAPKIVSIEISGRCNLNCEECYVKDKSSAEMSGGEIERLLDELAEMKVFQVSFGGGEPFMRRDIFDLAEHTVSLGLVVTATTNGTLLPDNEKLRVFKQVNVSYHGDFKLLVDAIGIVRNYTAVGVNFVASKTNVPALPAVEELCRRKKVEVLLLTYKPVNGDYENQVSPGEVMKLAQKLAESGLKVAFDGLTCAICVAAEYFVDVSSTGDVYPCSFIREPIGNVRKNRFAEIWRRRKRVGRCPYLKGK